MVRGQAVRKPITGISSMATRQVLAELAVTYEHLSGQPVVIESVGGVDAARRVQDGEAFDIVVLASHDQASVLPSRLGSRVRTCVPKRRFATPFSVHAASAIRRGLAACI
jgi:hypothetical protein